MINNQNPNSEASSSLLLDIAFYLGKYLSIENTNKENYQLVVETLGSRLGWDYGEVWFVNHLENIIQKSNILYLSEENTDLKILQDYRSHISWRLDEGVPGIVQADKKAMWLSDFHSNYPIHKKEKLLELNIKSGVAIPVYSEEHVFAVLFFMSKHSKTASTSQMDLYNLLAGRLGTMLLKIDLEREIIKAKNDLKSSIDLNFSTLNKILMYRDPYTVDHQKRVAAFALKIATEMGYSELEIEELILASQLHDIGKIAIPLEILNKPGHISKEEYALIKTHVETSYDLILTLPCSSQVKRMIHEHHEREDGSGYPLGLMSNEILPLSKILIISDVTSAMLEDRPYRKGLEIQIVLNNLLQGKGKIYDPTCVDIAIKILSSQIYSS